MTSDVSVLSDSMLIDAVRTGSGDAFETLYERHREAAQRFARQLASGSVDADDLVSEAFAKVLEAMRNGGGPDLAFRTYLLRVLRNVAYSRFRREGRVQFQDQVPDLPSVDEHDYPDSAVGASAERTLITKAFAQLPQRWQAVLWYTEVEQLPPVDVAPLLGLSPNGVSALAYRAREGMRQAYLQAHLNGTSADRCRATIERLGAWTREGLSRRETAQVEGHLDGCRRCRALAAELVDINGGMRAVIAPLVLGSAALGYLASSAASAPAAVTAVASGAASGNSLASSLTPQTAGVAISAVALAAAILFGLTVPDAASPAWAVGADAPPPARPGGPTGQPPVTTPPPSDVSTPPPAFPPAPAATPPPPAISPATQPPKGTVKTPAPGSESLDLAARFIPQAASAGPQPMGWLELTLSNTVGTPRPVTLTVTLPPGTNVWQPESPCHPSAPRTVSCSLTVQPGQSSTLTLTLRGRPDVDSTGTATATAGALKDSVSFPLKTP